MNSEEVICVRDRREKYQFSIHNRIIDEWVPIIGPLGYMLYSLYVRMASNDDERCFPGYRLIQDHLGIGASTVSDYNKLLVWAGLIYIESGNNIESNNYYILDIPEVTPDRLEKLRQQAQQDLKPESKFLACILSRLEDWRPIQAYWTQKKPKPVVVHPSQLSLLPADCLESQGTPVAEHPAPVAEHPTPVAEEGASATGVEQSESTIRINNPKGEGDAPAQKSLNLEKQAENIYEEYHGRLIPSRDVAKLESISRLVNEEGGGFNPDKWKEICRRIAAKNLKGRVDLCIQDYKAVEKASGPPGLTEERRSAYSILQAQTRMAELERAEWEKDFSQEVGL
jgi:hypothetical protein